MDAVDGRHRVGGGCNGQSEYVRKSFCISFSFVFGFASFVGGYILGRLAMEREFFLRSYISDFRPACTVIGDTEIGFEMDTLAQTVDRVLNATRRTRYENETVTDLMDAFRCERSSADRPPRVLKMEANGDGSANVSASVVTSMVSNVLRQTRDCLTEVNTLLESMNL